MNMAGTSKMPTDMSNKQGRKKDVMTCAMCGAKDHGMSNCPKTMADCPKPKGM